MLYATSISLSQQQRLVKAPCLKHDHKIILTSFENITPVSLVKSNGLYHKRFTIVIYDHSDGTIILPDYNLS